MKKGMRFSVLASGSKGNSLYVETEGIGLLVDVGLSCREISRRLLSIGVDPHGVEAVIITHEHSDHIRGVGPFSRRFEVPVYANRRTFEKGKKLLGNISMPITIQTGQTLTIKDLVIETFTKCHDAADPIGIVLSCNGKRMGYVTDLGKSTNLVIDRLKGCTTVAIEFNHDSEMLDQGPYPLDLKRRIKGSEGHLSNRQAAELLSEVSHDQLRHVVLTHLSEANNDPDRAYEEASAVLKKNGFSKVKILVGYQDEASPIIDLY